MVKCLTAEHLNLWVGARQLINDVSVTLEAGELVALIGPNGAGKSTPLRLLTGFLKAKEGLCCLDGRPLHDWPPEVLSRHRAVMLQQTRMQFDWPVEGIIAMGRAPRDRAKKVRLCAA